MKKEKSKSKSDKDVQRAIDAARKRWEFNLIKTGNIAATYSVGNVGKKERSARNAPLSLSGNQSALAAVDSSGVITNQPIKVRKQLVEDSVMIATVAPSAAYTQTAFVIQPGEPETFPWLSQVARLYERYQFTELSFEFRPTVSGFAEAGKQGRVTLYTNYDVLEPLAVDMVVAESIDPHVSGIAKNIMRLRLDPKRLNVTPLFVRSGAVIGFSDAKTYDAGRFVVATQGMPEDATGSIGEIWVHYKCMCINPRLNNSPSPVPPYVSLNGRFYKWRTPLVSVTSTASAWRTVDLELFSSALSVNGGLDMDPALYNYGGRLPILAQAVFKYTLTVTVFASDAADGPNSIIQAKFFLGNISVAPFEYDVTGEFCDIPQAVGARKGLSQTTTDRSFFFINTENSTVSGTVIKELLYGWNAGTMSQVGVSYQMDLTLEYCCPTTFAGPAASTCATQPTGKLLTKR